MGRTRTFRSLNYLNGRSPENGAELTIIQLLTKGQEPAAKVTTGRRPCPVVATRPRLPAPPPGPSRPLSVLRTYGFFSGGKDSGGWKAGETMTTETLRTRRKA